MDTIDCGVIVEQLENLIQVESNMPNLYSTSVIRLIGMNTIEDVDALASGESDIIWIHRICPLR